MLHERSSRPSWLAAILLLACFTLPAAAYLDPATGSMILQLVLGGVAGAAVAVKLFWHRILGFFSSAESDEAGD